ncbi:MAG: class I SAM-dependent methyltransferase, partial [Acidobacteria bacterium]
MSAHGTLGTLFYAADKTRASAGEVAWYAARLPRDAGPVLEAMVGSGRLLVPLLEAGFEVHGVDSSEAMLANCEQRIAIGGRATQLYRQNVTTLNLPTRYAAAFIAAGSFQRLADPIDALDT